MLKWIIVTFCFFLSASVLAINTKSDLEALAQTYFDYWVATQSPKATEKDVENYLSLLTNDIGHQHLPYDSDDKRESEGKVNMKKGMMYYLGAHTEHSANINTITVGYNVIVIKYDTLSKGIHPETKQVVSFSYDTTEVLEIEEGKVSVIRKYSE